MINSSSRSSQHCAAKCASYRSIFDSPKLKVELEQVEEKTSDPNFWNDSENSQKIMRERKRLEDALATDSELTRRVEDISAYFELASEGEQVDEEVAREMNGTARGGGEARDRDSAQRGYWIAAMPL